MFLKILKDIWNGKSLARSLFNSCIENQHIEGITVDIGGGNNPEYWNILKNPDKVKIYSLDLKKDNKINLEIDNLPYSDSQVDTILMFNILEHIYNYKHLVAETVRILKTEKGRIIGFVPFLVNYHPDPHDYFRYTKESLRKIFEEVGVKDIEILEVGRGPFCVNYNNIVLSIPKIIKIIIFPVYYILDSIFLFFRPKITKRYPLGYFFTCKK